MLEVYDLVLSKLAEGRERDWDFARAFVHHGLCDPVVLVERAETLPIGGDQIQQIRRAVETW